MFFVLSAGPHLFTQGYIKYSKGGLKVILLPWSFPSGTVWTPLRILSFFSRIPCGLQHFHSSDATSPPDRQMLAHPLQENNPNPGVISLPTHCIKRVCATWFSHQMAWSWSPGSIVCTVKQFSRVSFGVSHWGHQWLHWKTTLCLWPKGRCCAKCGPVIKLMKRLSCLISILMLVVGCFVAGAPPPVQTEGDASWPLYNGILLSQECTSI